LILTNIVVGYYNTNTYFFGSSVTREISIIDPGSEPERIVKTIEKLNAKPVAVLLTHGHGDHAGRASAISNHYDIPVMFHNKSRRAYGGSIRTLKEGDIINIGEFSLHALETPGHTSDSLCFYSKDVKEYKGRKIDGIIFTGDLIYKKVTGGSSRLLFSFIETKIMYNPEITDDFLMFPGHSYYGMVTSVGEERKSNTYRTYFLKEKDL
jgi:glyoxylase-like metal-dependent hydrolase (beta-lactamase superfamily II)